MKLTPNKLVQVLTPIYSSSRKIPSIMLWGQPGVGKSDAVRTLAKNLEQVTKKEVKIQDVRLLDGGRVKWEKDGRGFTTAVPTPKAGNFSATKADKSIRASLNRDVIPAVRKKGSVDMVDIRSADEYSGKIFAPAGFQELAVRAGHIPGAVNVPWGLNVNADGTFKTVAELKKLYADKGIDGKKTIITYCRIGERSSLTWFVLSEILGYEVKNYDGSWTEYGNSVGNPISNPAGTIWGAS
jgi:thiosulfate/3-mercaptopyruvate sulfurtransferase